MEHLIIHDQSGQRFELSDNAHAYVEYEFSDGTIVFTSTQVPVELEGKGVGSALVKTALDFAKANKYTILAECPFIKTYLLRHPEYLS